MKAALTAVLVVALIIAIRVIIGLHEPNVSFFDTEQPARYAWMRTAWLAAVMILGIVLGHLHSRLGALRPDARIHIRSELANALTSGAFWRSLAASPIVFGATYWMSKNQPDPVVAAVLALENGFFCDVLFKRRERELSAGEGSTVPTTSATDERAKQSHTE
jgi:hypothetical protein